MSETTTGAFFAEDIVMLQMLALTSYHDHPGALESKRTS